MKHVDTLDSNADLSVLLCGPMPEPVGGVSIHLDRLLLYLIRRGVIVDVCDEAKKKKAEYFNFRSGSPLKYLSKIHTADVVHVHSSPHIFRFVHLLTASIFRKPLIVTLHSWRTGDLTSVLWRTLFRLFRVEIIFVNNVIASKLRLPGTVMPAFILPDLSQEQSLPDDLFAWINTKKQQGTSLVVSNAYKISWHDSEDLYGLDICIRCFAEILQQKSNLAMIFVVANHLPSKNYLDEMDSLLIERGISENFLIYRGVASFSRLLDISDISIRATNTDGDSLSVRESLALGCQTIASDCVERPSGTTLFKTRCHKDLAAKVVNAKDKIEKSSDKSEANDCTHDLFELYVEKKRGFS